jgi:ABC-2 type transport system permease protein
LKVENGKRMMKRRSIQNIGALGLLLVVIIAINSIVQYNFFRIDLTGDKRYSLSKGTIEKVKSIDDIVFLKVYLEGDLPADFKMLRNSTKEILDEFRAYNSNIQYQFINPSEKDDKNERFKVYRQLAQEGLAYYNIPVENKDGFAQKTVFPSAMINFQDRSYPLNLLVSSRSVPTEADISNSVQKLELNLVTALHYLTTDSLKSIAFTTGHGELPPLETADIAFELSKSYRIEQVELNGQINALNKRVAVDSLHTEIVNRFDMVIVAKPDSVFNERDKFILDQYLMHGGKILWLLDAIDISMDSLRNQTSTIGLPLNLNLDDMLFRYGVRIKNNLVLNRKALEIGTAEGALRRWDYFPIATANKDHLTGTNINALKTQFVSSVDTIQNGLGKKTVILQTADACRLMPAPVVVDVVDIIYRRPNPALYSKPAQNIGILIEGTFKSNYENRIGDPRLLNDNDMKISYSSKPTSIAVFADGDLIRNQVIQQSNGPYPLPLGFDRFTQKMFDNKKLLLNTINYMLGDMDFIQLRSKEFKIRLLDKDRIVKEKLKWQVLNTILPLVFIILLGLGTYVIKRRKYIRKD